VSGETLPLRPDTSSRLRSPARDRRWLPAIAVLGVVLATTLGGFVVAAALSEPAGEPVSIPGVVAVTPLSGWEPAEPSSIDGRPFVRLTRGNGTLAALAWGPFAGDAAALAAAVRDDVLGSLLEQLTVSDRLTVVRFDQGLVGRRFTYVGIDRGSGSAVEGEVTTVISPEGQGVAFVGIAPEGLLAFIAGDLQTMVSDATVGVGA
jgi:hypothetical protein